MTTAMPGSWCGIFWPKQPMRLSYGMLSTLPIPPLRWYMTIHLQYGFCYRQIPRVTDWLCGLPPPKQCSGFSRPQARNGVARSSDFLLTSSTSGVATYPNWLPAASWRKTTGFCLSGFQPSLRPPALRATPLRKTKRQKLNRNLPAHHPPVELGARSDCATDPGGTAGH